MGKIKQQVTKFSQLVFTSFRSLVGGLARAHIGRIDP